MDTQKTYWFGRKRFGWGIGPKSWQGWLVSAVYVAVLIGLRHLGPKTLDHQVFLVLSIVSTLVFVGVIAWKFERRSPG
ncbi:hypothetical protein J2T07_000189 [Luteibacter jiangsuensis]|uniref:Uncharacterized protein n=1 Tax=Luteibacter jiangsuensis TaxID=637577 RepID=A0ABT9SSS1_9GAMM|nr:hypothetical protein [Luteibacter jiangsuensis]MDQ0008030.1 hypothetical protein [Luteibacter jiangsuensis]